MDKFSLIMVLHSHQPVGNFDHVFSYAVERCYRPVLDILSRYPEFKCGLHFSGPLLSWLEAHDPEFLDSAAAMCERGQVEMLSGGYYEPLLAPIPHQDAVAQLNKQTEYTRRRFGVNPTGFWLAERIWEPGLPAKLAPCGMRYSLVDDTHLYYAGLAAKDMFGYQLTEREGHPLALFPTHKELRYSIPFKEPEVTLDFLHHCLDDLGPSCATYGDDSEKFGLWPDTYEWVIEKGWLARFIEAVLAADDWLTTEHPGRYLEEHPPSGRVYLPTASYEEMLTWALPAQAAIKMERLVAELKQENRYEEMRQFLRGGLWDNFLVKYRESNLMHKRMLFISDKLREMNASEEAWDHLYQAQCNCAYWHGLFGGLYLNHLRHAVHEHLIAAEDLVDRQTHGDAGWARAEVVDLDLDGHEEVLLAGPELDTVIHPSYGGSMSLFSLRPKRFNLAGALTRRPEAYHILLTEPRADAAGNGGEPQSAHDVVKFKEEGLEEYLIYDWYQRGMFQDHIMGPAADLASLRKADFHEWGDFVDQPFTLEGQGADDGRAWCRLVREGHAWAPEGAWPITLRKTFGLGPGPRLEAAYRLDSQGGQNARFGLELNFSLLASGDPNKRVEINGGQALPLDRQAEAAPADGLSLVDEVDGFRVEIGLSRPAAVWCFPIETVSHSESGLERTYQGSSLCLVWDLPDGPNQFEVTVSLEVK